MKDEFYECNKHLMVWEMRIDELCLLIWNLNYIKTSFYIDSLPCYLFVFVSLSVMIVFYMGADEISGDRAP